MSNQYLSLVKEGTLIFKSSEHCFMHSKALFFKDTNCARQIHQASSPQAAKNLGRKVRNYNEKAWAKARFNQMVAVLRLKFHNKELANKLLDTGSSVLAEASASDKIWGIGLSAPQAERGATWVGENLLGKCLMQIRSELRVPARKTMAKTGGKSRAASAQQHSGNRVKPNELGGENHKQRQLDDAKCKLYAEQTAELQLVKCMCATKCSGTGSDTPHGSHLFLCKVPYGRFLSLKEKFLTSAHHSRPNSGSHARSKWCILEFMCGVAALSAIWAALGVMVGGLCEKKGAVLDAVSSRHPDAMVCNDVRDGTWKQWDISTRVEVLTGGPPCNPYTGAGPQLGEEHKDAGLIMAMADVGHFHKARWIMLEEVCELLTKFKAYYTRIIQYFQGKSYLHISSETLQHQQLGGQSRRARLWPLFEDVELAGQLPPWQPHVSALVPGCVRSALSRVDQVQDTDFLVGRLDRYSEPVVGKGGVTRVGNFITGGGNTPLVRGSAVKLKPEQNGCVVAKFAGGTLKLSAADTQFVVLSVTQDKVRLFYDHRKTPAWLYRRRHHIASQVAVSTPVYSIDAPGPTIRSMKVPPAENGFLIEDVRF